MLTLNELGGNKILHRDFVGWALRAHAVRRVPVEKQEQTVVR
jgi:hypothetical protein